VCQRCDSCNWYVAGVVSFGKGCAQASFYGVYANVVEFEEWIAERAGMTVTKTKTCGGKGWTEWGEWTECSLSCGGGTQTRVRSCNNALVGSSSCIGLGIEEQRCNENICNDWSQWTTDGVCSKLCDGGLKKFTRECIITSRTVGQQCVGEDERIEACNVQPCAAWGEFSFLECSKSCGGGTKIGIRQCEIVSGSGATCVGEAQTSESCNVESCDLPTTEWSECSATCGGGEATRLFKGVPETQVCNDVPCPSWTPWDQWTACSATCGPNGVQTAQRMCLNGWLGDIGCEGPTTNQQDCNRDIVCPTWSAWSDYAACSVSCGGGFQVSTRTCVNGQIGQLGCNGESTKQQECNAQQCPTWSSWMSTQCSATCGFGIVSQQRTCLNGSPGDLGCEGEVNQVVECQAAVECPRWDAWSSYGSCSVTCGSGEKTRTRRCLFATEGASGCAGSSSETVSCDETACPSTGGPCAGLTNSQSFCQEYAYSYNFCEAYVSYMKSYCGLACCEKNYAVTVKPAAVCEDKSGYASCYQYKPFCHFDTVQEQCQKTCQKCS